MIRNMVRPGLALPSRYRVFIGGLGVSTMLGEWENPERAQQAFNDWVKRHREKPRCWAAMAQIAPDGSSSIVQSWGAVNYL